MSLFTKEQFEFALSKEKYMPREEAIDFLKFMKANNKLVNIYNFDNYTLVK